MNRICVLGLGYIGLPTASLMATRGYDVLGVDVNSNTVNTINQGNIHIHEPDLDVLVKAAVQSGKLKASLKPAEADVFIVAVPTPFKDRFVPDLTYVEEATRSIAPYVKEGNLIVLESTSPVGTTELMKKILQQTKPDFAWDEVHFAHCPERVLPGQILKELVSNDRVIGGLTPLDAEVAEKFYRNFVTGAILLTDARTAEMTKLTENAFRDTNIAFANELSIICDKLGIDVWRLIELANRHPRVKILQPGPGVGGHCIAVDPWFIVDSAPEEARLMRTAREVNDSKPKFILEKIRAAVKASGKNSVACLGAAFKANVDDLRSSPALEIIEALAADGLQVSVVEPHIQQLPSSIKQKKNISLLSIEDAMKNNETIALLVDHQHFRSITKEQLKNKKLIDTRGFWR